MDNGKKKFVTNSSFIPTNEIKTIKTKSVITYDMDIMVAHDLIIKHLENTSELSDKEEILKRLRWIESNSNNHIEVISAQKEIFKIQKILNSMSSNKRLEQYKRDVSEVIENCKKQQTVKKSFLKVTNTGTDQYKQKFFGIAKNYIHIDIPKKSVFKCNNCDCVEFEQIDNNLYRCEECSTCKRVLEDSQSFKDADRLNMSTRYTYSKRAHFIEAIQKYQCIRTTKINNAVYVMIQKEMVKNKISKERLTKEHIRMFLSDSKLSKHYDDMSLIYHTITEKTPPNITQYENELMVMFDLQEKIFDDIKHQLGRRSSLNVNYKLMKMLQLLGHVCSPDDFNFLKTRDKIIEHDETWKIICEHAGWKFSPTL